MDRLLWPVLNHSAKFLIASSCAGADEEFSTMASLELPELQDFERSQGGAGSLHAHLRKEFGIEIPTQFWEGRLWARISAQLFNVPEDYLALQQAIINLRKHIQTLGPS